MGSEATYTVQTMSESSNSASLRTGASIPLKPAPARRKVPLTRPLRHARYRNIWLANMVSNMGTWIQTLDSAWLDASLSKSASITSLVQTATYVLIFLLALMDGVVHDVLHRPKFLFYCNLYMAL